jgi:hypothetical protein
MRVDNNNFFLLLFFFFGLYPARRETRTYGFFKASKEISRRRNRV